MRRPNESYADLYQCQYASHAYYMRFIHERTAGTVDDDYWMVQTNSLAGGRG